MATVTPHPKPERRKGNAPIRIRYTGAVLRKCLRERECRRCGYAAGSGHHIVPKGSPHFGDDVEENVVPLCGSGTTGCHGEVERHVEAACREVGAKLRDDEIAYVLRKLGPFVGRAFLRTYYYREV